MLLQLLFQVFEMVNALVLIQGSFTTILLKITAETTTEIIVKAEAVVEGLIIPSSIKVVIQIGHIDVIEGTHTVLATSDWRIIEATQVVSLWCLHGLLLKGIASWCGFLSESLFESLLLLLFPLLC